MIYKLGFNQLFKRVDSDNSGFLSLEEELKMHRKIDGDDFDEGKVTRLFNMADEDGNGKLSMDESKVMMFKKVDSNGDDKITFEEHWIIIKADIENKIEAEKTYFDSLDIDEDGSWSFEEAKKFMIDRGFNALFEMADSDDSGSISLVEELKMVGKFDGDDLDEGKVTEMFNNVDADENGELSKDESMILMFKRADSNGDDMVSFEEHCKGLFQPEIQQSQ